MKAPARAPPLAPLKVSANTAATLAGNVVHALCQAGLVIALTHLGEPAMVGQYAMGIAVSTPIMLLASLQLNAVHVTDPDGHHRFDEYVALRVSTSLIALVLIISLALIIAGNDTAAIVIILVGLAKSVEAVADVYRALMQRSERMERVAVSMILRTVLALSFFTLALIFDAGLAAAVSGLVIANTIAWRAWDVRSVPRLLRSREPLARNVCFGVKPRFQLHAVRLLARTALPLGVVAMLLSLNGYAPQLIIMRFGGAAELGIFAALWYAASASGVFISAAGQAASPRLAKLYQHGNASAFRHQHYQLLAFGVAVSLTAIAIAFAFGEPLLRVVYGTEYAARTTLFMQLCVVAAIVNMVSLQGFAVTSTRSFRSQLPVAGAVVVATVVTAMLLVPPYGARGAVAALVAGAFAQGVGYTWLLRRAVTQMPAPIPQEHAHALA